MVPLEDTQQKKLGEPLGIATEGFMMGRRLTRPMEPHTTGKTEPSANNAVEKEQPPVLHGWPSKD